MKSLLVLSCLVAVALAAPSLHTAYRGHQVLQVHLKTEAQVEWLEAVHESGADLDFWSHGPHVGADVEIHVTPENKEYFVQLLADQGITYDVVIEDLQDLVNKESISNFNAQRKRGRLNAVGYYARTNEIYDLMDALEEQHSDLVSVIDIGETYEGRRLKVLKLSSGSGKQAMFINSGFHSREWISHASVIWIMNEMVTKYGSEADITSVVNDYDWYFFPMANPDGYEYSHDHNRFWRKTRSATAFCYGTDPNRNWDSNFGGAGTSSFPCSDQFHGGKAFSEKETLASSQFLTKIHNEQTIKMFLDVHAYSQLWFVPYGYTKERPADYVELDRVAHIGADALEQVNGKKFRVGTPPAILYAASGGGFDWAHETLGVKYSFGMELRPTGGGMNGFVVDAKEIPDSGREVMVGLIAAANAMH